MSYKKTIIFEDKFRVDINDFSTTNDVEKELGEERLCNDLLRKQLKTLKRTKDQEL